MSRSSDLRQQFHLTFCPPSLLFNREAVIPPGRGVGFVAGFSKVFAIEGVKDGGRKEASVLDTIPSTAAVSPCCVFPVPTMGSASSSPFFFCLSLGVEVSTFSGEIM
jgi:hypothetical protein